MSKTPNAPSGVPLDPRGLPPGYAFKPEWEITPRQVREALRNATAAPMLLDCREPDEFALCRIEGAVLVPLGQIEQRAEELEADDGSRSREIVVYCHHGRRSVRAATTLRALGFTNVRSMAGGIDVWSIDVDSAVARY